MSGIKRWDIAALGNGFTGMKQRDDGAFVRNADHEAEVARLRAEVEKMRGYEVAPLEAKVSELRAEADALRAEVEENENVINVWRGRTRRAEAEADALRVDAMRYRWLRNEAHKVDEMSPAVLLAEAAFPVDNCHTAGFVFGDELDEQVDAAMGADA